MSTDVRMLVGVTLLSVLFAITPATALEPGRYPVGYRRLEKLDHSRSFGEAAPPWRPVQIHVWYPSVAQPGSEPLRYGDYVRAAAGVGDIQGDRNDGDAAQALLDQWRGSPQRRGAEAQSVDDYLERTVLAVSEAEPAPGPFPLIVYAASWNADPYENAELFEYLASHGYVVAGVPSMGSDEVAMALKVEGAAAQRDDLAFALATLAVEPYIDAARIGAAGFSWGGLTSLLLTLQHRGVSAVVCLDGACRMENYRDIAEASSGGRNAPPISRSCCT